MVKAITYTSFRKKINYRTSVDGIRHFVDSSAICRQFTRIECNSMVIFGAFNKQYGCLVDRKGLVMNYFGGGPQNGIGENISMQHFLPILVCDRLTIFNCWLMV